MPALVSCATTENAIEDIEDIGTTFPKDAPTNRIRKYVSLHRHETPNKPQIRADSIIPGSQSIFIKTWGCTHNTSDSEYMAGQLASYGYIITGNKEDADLWLLNSCTVKNPAEDHLRNEIKHARALDKFLVIAGCVSQSSSKSQFLNGLSLIGVQQIDRIVEVVEETLKGYSVRLLGQKKENGRKKGGASLLLPKIRKNPYIEIIPINTGCLNQCTYCKTRYARGHLGSYSIEEIVERAIQAFNEGVCEIWLTSEDTGAYGRDLGVVLPDLLWELVKVVPDGCRVRLGMTNPPYILDHLEEMAKILALPCFYGFLHIPVQSGSNQVLSDMKREYTVQDFEKIVAYLRDRIPGLTIATDLICGFPTETEEDFAETMTLVEKHEFPSLFINQFYPRPTTPAAKLPRIPTNIVKQRTKRVSALFQKLFPYENREGNAYRVLVTEISHDNNHYVGHNKFYEQVLIPKEEDYMGKMIDVEIVGTGKHYMMAKVLKNGLAKSPAIAPLLQLDKIAKTQIIAEPRKLPNDVLPFKWKILMLYAVVISIAIRFLNKYWLRVL